MKNDINYFLYVSHAWFIFSFLCIALEFYEGVIMGAIVGAYHWIGAIYVHYLNNRKKRELYGKEN